MSQPQTRVVIDAYDEREFEDLLSEAEGNAKPGFEEIFTSEMRGRFGEYGAQMFISDRQIEILERIASGD